MSSVYQSHLVVLSDGNQEYSKASLTLLTADPSPRIYAGWMSVLTQEDSPATSSWSYWNGTEEVSILLEGLYDGSTIQPGNLEPHSP